MKCGATMVLWAQDVAPLWCFGFRTKRRYDVSGPRHSVTMVFWLLPSARIPLGCHVVNPKHHSDATSDLNLRESHAKPAAPFAEDLNYRPLGCQHAYNQELKKQQNVMRTIHAIAYCLSVCVCTLHMSVCLVDVSSR
jgi:hypothetical protein